MVGQWAVLTRNTAREGGYVTITASSHGLLKEGFTLAQASLNLGHGSQKSCIHIDGSSEIVGNCSHAEVAPSLH